VNPTVVATGGFPLFGYGTFRDTAWRCEILGADYPWQLATLAGWQRVTLPEYGYLSIRESPFEIVEGVLVELDDVGWRVADAWEEVPRYHRIDVSARTSDGLVGAAAYAFSGNHEDARIVEDEALLAAISARDVERSIRAFKATRDALRSGRR